MFCCCSIRVAAISVGLGRDGKKTSLTRDVALRVLSLMRKGDAIALIQSGDRADVLQPWTDDRDQVGRDLENETVCGQAFTDL